MAAPLKKLTEEAEENRKETKLKLLVSRPTIELGTCRINVKSIMNWARALKSMSKMPATSSTSSERCYVRTYI